MRCEHCRTELKPGIHPDEHTASYCIAALKSQRDEALNADTRVVMRAMARADLAERKLAMATNALRRYADPDAQDALARIEAER